MATRTPLLDTDDEVRHPSSLCDVCKNGADWRGVVDRDFFAWMPTRQLCETHRLSEAQWSKHLGELALKSERRAKTIAAIQILMEQAERASERDRISSTCRAAIQTLIKISAWALQMEQVGSLLDLDLLGPAELEAFAQTGILPDRLSVSRRG